MMKFHDRLLPVLPLHSKCTVCVKGKKIKMFQNFRNRYFQVHIRNQLQKISNSSPNTAYSDKDFVNAPICLIWMLAFKREFTSSRRIGCCLPKKFKKSPFLTSYVYMGRKKITILTENEMNNHQIYVPVFYLIEINILIAFWGQKWWNFTIVSSQCCLSIANARCVLRGKKSKLSKISEIDIFKFIFGISFKK